MKEIVEVVLFVLIYLVGELLANWLIFPWLNRKYPNPSSSVAPQKPGVVENSEEPFVANARTQEGKAKLKGHLERIVVFLGLAAGVHQVLILFGALKLGTFFLQKDQVDEKISKDYFLIGNLLSVLLTLCYFILWQWSSGTLWKYLDAIFHCN